jgi:hypothetical protein
MKLDSRSINSVVVSDLSDLNIDVEHSVDEMKDIYCHYHDDGSAKMTFVFNYEDDFVPLQQTCETSRNLLHDVWFEFFVGITVNRKNIGL